MAVIYKNHYKSYLASCVVCDIVFNQEFSSLYDELALLYKKYNIDNPEREAFHDAFYSFLTQKETGLQALSL